jgi:hypothetical protein
VEQHLRYVARETMHVIARLRKVRPREFARLDQGKDLGVDLWAKRLDRIPGDRAASAFASRRGSALFRGAILAGAVALSWQGQGIRVDEGGLLIAAASLPCGVDNN